MSERGLATDVRSVALTLGVAGACWLVLTTQGCGMDMGVATALGPFPSFLGVWTLMMTAMMLPGAAPAVLRYARTHRPVSAIVVFLAAYATVWTIIGIAVYGIYRPHGTAVAGVVTALAGLYELTPFKRHARRRCQQRIRSGYHLGMYCVGSSIGLMAMLLAVGAMSITWMSAITALVLLQKLCPPRRAIDVPIAVAIVTIGTVILLTPSSIPGLLPSM